MELTRAIYDKDPNISSTDWQFDGYSGIPEAIYDIDWLQFAPTPEAQSRRDKYVRLSTPACTNFATTNAVEFQVNRLRDSLSEDALEELEKGGFFDGDARFNLSDSFSAATSGTTQNGNSSWYVGHVMRNMGVCSQRVREWADDVRTWEQFIAPPTPAQLENAKLLLKHFEFKQQWVFTDPTDRQKWDKMRRALKTAPLIVSVPCCGNWFRMRKGETVDTCSIAEYDTSKHAVSQPAIDILFDSYDPWLKKIEEGKYPIIRAWQMVVTIKPQEKPAIFNRDLFLGRTGEDVRALQQYLNVKGFVLDESGAGSPGQETDYFGHKTKNALIRFQNHYADAILKPVGLRSGTGYFGASTRKFINGS